MLSSPAFVLLAVLLGSAPVAAVQREKPAVPDLTAGGQPDEKHDWNLGPTGARGWMWGWKRETIDARQILVTQVAPGSPAEGVLEVGDVILGVEGEPFARDAREALGDAITAAESRKGRGELRLLRWRGGERAVVTLRLDVLGDYADSAPWDCPKSRVILERACEHIAANMKGNIDGMMNALALLATGDRRYAEPVRKLAHEVGSLKNPPSLAGRTSGLLAWEWGYRTVFLCEYKLATGDRKVMPAIVEYATRIAEGQSGVGTWGHGMAWPDLNEGRLHGSLGGYGALNQAGLVCHLALVLAKKCGVREKEVDTAIVRANRFAEFYEGKGAIPYGDHRPGADIHDDNGKNSLAALIFDLQGLREEARFFGKMTIASYDERERGHTGNYFSYLWGPLGAARVGRDAAAAFLGEQRWFYDLGRAHDGRFPYQGGAGMSGSEHKYAGWDCTGAFVLASTLPRKELFLTGKGVHASNRIRGEELEDVMAAGRGFDEWARASGHYGAMDAESLLSLVQSWSPAVRSRASAALAKAGSEVVPRLLKLLAGDDIHARYGACEALGALHGQAKAAVPALIEMLDEEDVWLRIQAASALAGIGDDARKAVPAMLRLALREDPEDPREFTQRYLAFCLFYRGGALGGRGILARSIDGVDRGLLLPAIERLLRNDDGRARSAVGSVYKHLTLEEISPLLPAIQESIRTPSPSGVMFANGIRLAGLELFAQHRIAEGMELCIDVTEIQKWGKKDRIQRCLKILSSYGGAARSVLPRLRDLHGRLEVHSEARALAAQIELCKDTIEAIESAPESDPLRTLEELVPASRSGR